MVYVAQDLSQVPVKLISLSDLVYLVWFVLAGICSGTDSTRIKQKFHFGTEPFKIIVPQKSPMEKFMHRMFWTFLILKIAMHLHA